MKKISLFLSFSLLLCSFCFAYVPPSDFQIKQILKKRASLKSIRIYSRVTDGVSNLKETIWYDTQTKMLYGKISDEKNESIYSYQKKLGETGVTATQLLFEQNNNEFNKIIVSESIDTNDSNLSLGRVKQHIGWVFGLKTPSLWIMKDEFYPLKWYPKNAPKNFDIEFLETKLIKEFPYSRLITLNEDGKERMRVEAIEVSLNPDLSELRKSSFTDSSSPSHKLIESLLQWIR